jgi:hypothetical protein|tara:strand:- start:114 stop:455 length:342 start_codon:yes stop_codon:yes gene_type:complete
MKKFILYLFLITPLLTQEIEGDKKTKKEQRADREIIRQELVRNRMIAESEFKRFEERHKKLHEKEKKMTKRKIVVSYILIGAAGYTLGYLSSKEDLKNWAWKKENKKDDWKRK